MRVVAERGEMQRFRKEGSTRVSLSVVMRGCSACRDDGFSGLQHHVQASDEILMMRTPMMQRAACGEGRDAQRRAPAAVTGWRHTASRMMLTVLITRRSTRPASSAALSLSHRSLLSESSLPRPPALLRVLFPSSSSPLSLADSCSSSFFLSSRFCTCSLTRTQPSGPSALPCFRTFVQVPFAMSQNQHTQPLP